MTTELIKDEEVRELVNKHIRALLLIVEAGQTQGGHHKAWYIDQIARTLSGDGYADLIDGLDWDEGIAP